MEPEYYLHIRAVARESAAHLSLRADHGGGTYGLWQTTAVNWYLEQRAKAQPLRIVRISV